MQNNKKLWTMLLALLVGGIIGYALASTQMSSTDLEGNAVRSRVATQVLQPEQSANVDPAVLAAAIENAPEDADTVMVTDRTGNKVMQVVPKRSVVTGGWQGDNYGNPVGYGDVWQFTNGNHELLNANAPWGTRAWHESLYFKGKVWVIGGCVNPAPVSPCGVQNPVWSSSDGTTWTNVTTTPSLMVGGRFAAATFAGKMWIFKVSSLGAQEVWSSSDGEHWAQSPVPPWPARNDFSALVFNNKLWIMGGTDFTSNYYNDVWWTTDGVTWTQATANAGWVGRQGFATVVYKNKMFVMGGRNASLIPNSGYLNDVWSSSDGINWTQKTANGGWFPRANFRAYVSMGGWLEIFGGGNSNSSSHITKKDFWTSFDGINWMQSPLVGPQPDVRDGYGIAKVPDTFGKMKPLLINSATALTTVSGPNNDKGDFVVHFKIKALGADVYIPSLVSPTGNTSVDYAVGKNGVGEITAAQYSQGVTAVLLNTSGSSPTTNGNYKISDGTTENFSLHVYVTNGGPLTQGVYRARINDIRFNLTDSNSSYASYTTLDQFVTNWLYMD